MGCDGGGAPLTVGGAVEEMGGSGLNGETSGWWYEGSGGGRRECTAGGAREVVILGGEAVGDGLDGSGGLAFFGGVGLRELRDVIFSIGEGVKEKDQQLVLMLTSVC